MLKKTISLLVIVILLSSCQAKDLLDSTLNRIKTGYNRAMDFLLIESKEKIYDLEPQKVKVEVVLDQEGQEAIDNWLTENNLNQYGDSEGTTYQENPLYNQETGSIKNRYQHVLEKYPELIEQLNLTK